MATVGSEGTFVLFDARATTGTSDPAVAPKRAWRQSNRGDPGRGSAISFDIKITDTASVQLLAKIHPDSDYTNLGTATSFTVTRTVTAPVYSVAAQVVSISSGTVTVLGIFG